MGGEKKGGKKSAGLGGGEKAGIKGREEKARKRQDKGGAEVTLATICPLPVSVDPSNPSEPLRRPEEPPQ